MSSLLSACKLPAPAENQPTQDLNVAVYTSAAQTVEAASILRPQGTPTSSGTPLPPDKATQTAAWTPGPSPTLAGADDSGPLPENDRGEFVEDVSVPDGEAHAPGERFTKTWRLLNTGTTTWSAEYALVYISGALMEGPPSVPLPNAVAPGETVDVSVKLIAPADPGSYTGYWKLRNASGGIFGLGAEGTDAFWVAITVDKSRVTVTLTPVGKVISNIALRIDNPKRTAACPQVFRITVDFVIERASTVAYTLEAGNQENTPVKLPPPAVRNLDAGPHSVVYELTFSSTIHGWVKVHFTQPEDVISPQVDFMLVCES